MKIKEKSQRLVMALREGIDVWHGTDMTDDIVEVLEYITDAEYRAENAEERLNELKCGVNENLEKVVNAAEIVVDGDDDDALSDLLDGLEAINNLLVSDE